MAHVYTVPLYQLRQGIFYSLRVLHERESAVNIIIRITEARGSTLRDGLIASLHLSLMKFLQSWNWNTFSLIFLELMNFSFAQMRNYAITNTAGYIFLSLMLFHLNLNWYHIAFAHFYLDVMFFFLLNRCESPTLATRSVIPMYLSCLFTLVYPDFALLQFYLFPFFSVSFLCSRWP